MSNLVIGVASTAPAYSLAATLGFIVAVDGRRRARAGGAARLVRPDPARVARLPLPEQGRPRRGTTFAWTTRAFGPWIGWINGWAIFVADVIVMASLAVIAAQYTYLLFGWQLGGELDGWHHRRLGRLDRADDLDLLPRHRALGARCRCSCSAPRSSILALFAVVALVKVYAATRRPARSTSSCVVVQPVPICASARSSTASCSGSSSTGAGTRAWPSTRSRETPPEGPGKAAVVSTILLVLIYVVVSTAAQAYARHAVPRRDNSDDVLKRARHGRVRLAVGQAADHRRAHVGLGVDADDDPADRAHDAVDGALGRDPGGVRARSIRAT